METHGLTSQQYNGLHGVVERYVGNKGRYMVRLHGSPSDEKPLGLKPVNLRKLSQSAAVGPAAAIYTEPLLRLCVELAVADGNAAQAMAEDMDVNTLLTRLALPVGEHGEPGPHAVLALQTWRALLLPGGGPGSASFSCAARLLELYPAGLSQYVQPHAQTEQQQLAAAALLQAFEALCAQHGASSVPSTHMKALAKDARWWMGQLDAPLQCAWPEGAASPASDTREPVSGAGTSAGSSIPLLVLGALVHFLATYEAQVGRGSAAAADHGVLVEADDRAAALHQAQALLASPLLASDT